MCGPSPNPFDAWIEIDRDKQPGGPAGIYAAVKDAFWRAVDEGRTPGLRTTGTGTTSADCPALAVGNTPWNGANPPKYLDAFFDYVEVQNASGKWAAAANGSTVKVNAREPVRIRVTLTNLGEAKWLAPALHDGPGGVYVVAEGPQKDFYPVLRDVDCGGTTSIEAVAVAPAPETRVCLRLLAKGRTEFGPRFVLTLVQ